MVLLKIEKEGIPSDVSITEFEKMTESRFIPHLQINDLHLFKKIVKQTGKLYRKGELTRLQLWQGSYYRKELTSFYLPDVVFRWINPEIGWGVFANRPIQKGEFISEYGGLLRKKQKIDSKNSYCFQYAITEEHLLPYIIDARDQGGVARWINHSFHPNLLTTLATFDELTHIILIANEPISKGAQLLYDYGPDYWASRKGLQRIEHLST
ncbi:MAG TPA: SET domain-containing protein-lysine N-methyltransferase [Chlamydiales bacterium]|nr:SET domain-containing protein-lysine N-methyltransferase [Chlamydiales bacterium]